MVQGGGVPASRALHDDLQVAGPPELARLALRDVIERASAECGLTPIGYTGGARNSLRVGARRRKVLLDKRQKLFVRGFVQRTGDMIERASCRAAQNPAQKAFFVVVEQNLPPSRPHSYTISCTPCKFVVYWCTPLGIGIV